MTQSHPPGVRALCAALLALLLVACLADPDDLATADEAIVGGVNSGALAGILRITVAGQPDVHTGLLRRPTWWSRATAGSAGRRRLHR